MAITDCGNKSIGREGENKACKFLKKQGWKILERNYKNPYGEVDIIARRDGVVAFVEVKSRLSEIYGQPSEAVGYDRRRRYVRAAQYYFLGKAIYETVRFDIIEIYRGRINYIENAFGL